MTWSLHTAADNSLLAQSVRYVAMEPRVLGVAAEEKDPLDENPRDRDSIDNDPQPSRPQLLPSTVAQSVWDSACRQWQVSEDDDIYGNVHRALQKFADGAALPLTNLTLDRVTVKHDVQEVLQNLLVGQRTNITSLNWSRSTRGTSSTSPLIGRYIVRQLLRRNRPFEQLTSFRTDDCSLFADYYLIKVYRRTLAVYLQTCKHYFEPPMPASTSSTIAEELPSVAMIDADDIEEEDNDDDVQSVSSSISTPPDSPPTFLDHNVSGNSDEQDISYRADQFFSRNKTTLAPSFAAYKSRHDRITAMMMCGDDDDFDVDLEDESNNGHMSHYSITTSGEYRSLTELMPKLRRIHLDLSHYPSELLMGHSFVNDDVLGDVNDMLLAVLLPVSQTINWLELWNCPSLAEGVCLASLHQTRITHLSLYNCEGLDEALHVIGLFTQLTHLDVSQARRDSGQYLQPVSTLFAWVQAMPRLRHLDISNTNLADASSSGDRPSATMRSEHGVCSDIHGLLGLHHKLDTLGVFNCDTASHVPNLPAVNVAGDANEAQLILAMRWALDKSDLLCSVLNEVYALYRFGASDGRHPHQLCRHSDALHAILTAMSKWKHHSTLQIAASASIFYVIKKMLGARAEEGHQTDEEMTAEVKQHVVTALLNGMENVSKEHVMVRNATLVLCQFDIPGDIMFVYDRCVRLLVRALREHGGDPMTQRISIFLLNSMACMFDAAHKIACGKLGTIEIVLERIRNKWEAGECDEMMEVGWSFLWNVTDETVVNCERLCELQGLRLFVDCYQKFNDRAECVRNMMGLIGNIAEVQHLRTKLMEKPLLTVFVKLLLNNLDDGIEISYNSTGVLAHLCADGADVWRQFVPERQGDVDDMEDDEEEHPDKCLQWANVQAEIIAATAQWPLNARRFINYRSFGPILRLVDMSLGSPASTHWAVWALANLTTYTPSGGVLVNHEASSAQHADKYSSFVHKEGGVPLLRAVERHPKSSDALKALATAALQNTYRWMRKQNMEMPMEVDGE